MTEQGKAPAARTAKDESNEYGPIYEALQRVKWERDAARLREDSVHAFAKRLLGDGPNTTEMIRRAANRIRVLELALRFIDQHAGTDIYDIPWVRIHARAALEAASKCEPAEGRPNPEIPAIPDSKG